MKVAVFGAGTMGSGIAQVFAAKGHTALMYASSVASAQRHKDKLAASLNKKVAKGKMTQEDCDALLSRVLVEEFEAAADADLVIECVAEKMETKKELLGRLDAICKDSAIFASNTSSLSITEIGAGLKHPMVGMHFFNPVPAMKLVEVIAGANTPDELVEYIKNLSVEIGKTPVVVNEAPGFVVNKILIPYCNEGVCVLHEGVASAEDIDIAMQLGCNHPMGPLHLGDLIGWDIVLNIMDVLYNETHDSKYRANVLIRKMVRAGKLGIKSGEGFFNYKK
ncbi:MAG: 3-hydroxybutyryl-CoA dehydrogenase [Clostridiales bacterium]|nr:3-hydroxybutyryl-CoA dehydrogenase [Candidatus Cacconaster stercorequi]